MAANTNTITQYETEALARVLPNETIRAMSSLTAAIVAARSQDEPTATVSVADLNWCVAHLRHVARLLAEERDFSDRAIAELRRNGL